MPTPRTVTEPLNARHLTDVYYVMAAGRGWGVHMKHRPQSLWAGYTKNYGICCSNLVCILHMER